MTLLWANFVGANSLTADNILRLKKKVRTDENLKFLFDQLNKTTSMDLRETIIENISEQRKTKMLVETNLSFVAEPFGSVYSSKGPQIQIRSNSYFEFYVGFVIFSIVCFS